MTIPWKLKLISLIIYFFMMVQYIRLLRSNIILRKDNINEEFAPTDKVIFGGCETLNAISQKEASPKIR